MALSPVTINGWLAFNENGTGRWSKREPALDRSERAIQVSLKVPRELFRTPTLRASISVPDNTAPPTIEIEAVTVAEALKQVTGIDFDLRVIPPEEAE